jgi:hypothetical protein
MDTQKKLFAFKLAEQQAKDNEQKNEKWKARDGVAIAGCSYGANGEGGWLTVLSRDPAPSCI